MYQSYTVKILAQIWKELEEKSKHSLFCNFFRIVFKKIKNWLEFSVFGYFFILDNNLIKSSNFYKIHKSVIKNINNFFSYTRKNIGNIWKKSFLYKYFESVFQTGASTYINTGVILVIYFGGLILFTRNFGISRVYKVFMLLMLLSGFIFIIFKNHLSSILKNSKSIKYFVDFFILDEGENKWW